MQGWQTLLEGKVPAGQLVSTTQVEPVKNKDPEHVVQVVGVVEHPVHGAVHAGQDGAVWALPALQVRQFELEPLQVSHCASHCRQLAPASYQPVPQGFAQTFAFGLKPTEHVRQVRLLQVAQPGGHGLQI